MQGVYVDWYVCTGLFLLLFVVGDGGGFSLLDVWQKSINIINRYVMILLAILEYIISIASVLNYRNRIFCRNL